MFEVNSYPQKLIEAVKLYLAGKVDQWYFRKDTGAVIFIMNVATMEEARSLLESLPLDKAHIEVNPLHWMSYRRSRSGFSLCDLEEH